MQQKTKKPKKLKGIKKHYRGSVMPPIYQQSTIAFNCLADFEKATIKYATDGNETESALITAIKKLEKANFCQIVPSGLAAVTLGILALAQKGDHILVCDTAYGPTFKLCQFYLSKIGIEVDFYPSEIGTEIENYLQNNTKLIVLESPSSLFYQVQQIDQIVELAKAKKIYTAIDASYSSALLFKPLDFGIDVSMMALTKYCSGHSDLLMGSVATNDPVLANKINTTRKVLGFHTSAQECYLVMRGLPSAKMRIKKHSKNATQIAQFLSKQKQIEKVYFPLLDSFKQKQLYQKYFKSANGLISFSFKNQIPIEKIRAFVDELRLFKIGFSWGGFESLVMIYEKDFAKPKDFPANKPLIRLHIGLESVKKLKKDIKNALLKTH